MKKYRKKPVVIKALRYWKMSATDVINEFNRPMEIMPAPDQMFEMYPRLIIKTLEGDHIANYGDFIIQGVKGELYPCKPDIFDRTYLEEVDQ